MYIFIVCILCDYEYKAGKMDQWKKCLLTVDMESDLAISYDPGVFQ